MAKFGKWILGGLGWAFGGPIGGLIGFMVGTAIDETQIKAIDRTGKTHSGDVSVSLLVLVAAIMKADGKVVRSELDYVKKFWIQNFGTEHARQSMLILRDLVKKDIPVADVCQQIRSHTNQATRLELMHLLFAVALADGHLHTTEDNMIRQIAGFLGIQQPDLESIRAMFVKDNTSAYKILEISKNASDEEVKKAYRKMATKLHPDKVSHLGEEYQRDAKEKFQKVVNAYEEIKKERGIK